MRFQRHYLIGSPRSSAVINEVTLRVHSRRKILTSGDALNKLVLFECKGEMQYEKCDRFYEFIFMGKEQNII